MTRAPRNSDAGAPPATPEDPGADGGDLWTGSVLLAVAGCFGVLGLCLAGLWQLFPDSHALRLRGPQDFAAPRLETTPVADYAAWRASQQRRLDGGAGRMPIAAAMKAVADRGARGFDPGPDQ